MNQSGNQAENQSSEANINHLEATLSGHEKKIREPHSHPQQTADETLQSKSCSSC